MDTFGCCPCKGNLVTVNPLDLGPEKPFRCQAVDYWEDIETFKVKEGIRVGGGPGIPLYWCTYLLQPTLDLDLGKKTVR
ncbi:hypothetical protein TSMEX_010413 [Taenia solium]|eukprot:TsM_001126100 transcript=TsM_001126100 gene=TsM_001126100